MARARRFIDPGDTFHVIQRGNNRGPIFTDDEDRREFLLCLRRAARRYGIAIHGFVLMANHYHLAVTTPTKDSLPRTVKHFGGSYVQYYNRRHDRIGTLWSGRYRAIRIKSERQFLACLRYIDLNPVRAQLVASPWDYPWSSFREHASGSGDTWLSDHPVLAALGATTCARGEAYRALCDPI
jgi:putative transposase